MKRELNIRTKGSLCRTKAHLFTMKKLNEKLLIENIENAARYDIENNKIFGAAYYVFQEGNLAVERCYGTTSLNGDTPVTNTTLFRLASMTKPITAVATLILAERGLLSLEDTVSKYIPSFKNVHVIDASGIDHGVSKSSPTIKNLLTHTSGIGSFDAKTQGLTPEDKKTIDATIAYFVKAGLDFEPGTRSWYSGTAAFDVLTKIIELVSGTDYLTFLKKEIFAPCGMVDTTFEPDAEQFQRLVQVHDKVDGKNAVREMPKGCVFGAYPTSHYLGGAGLASTLKDYCRFANMLSHRGETEKGRLLSPETFGLLCTPQVPKEIMNAWERWGLGVRVITESTYPTLPVGAFGWSGYYGSHFWVDPINGIFAVYMKNSEFDGGAANESARNFEKAVYSSFEA